MKNSFKILILFILLASINFLFLIEIDSFVTIKYISILSISIIILKFKYLIYNKSTFKWEMLFFVGLILLEIVYSKITYNQDIKDIISQAIPYFVVLLYYPLTYKNNDYKIKYIKNSIIVISVILSSVTIIQAYLFNSFRLKFLNLNLGAMMRFGEVRITAGSMLICIGIILAFGMLVNGNCDLKSKALYSLTTLIGLYNIVFINKTRMVLLVLGISIISMIIVSGYGKFSKIRNVYVVIVLFVVVINLPIVKSYINVSETDAFSTDARVEAIEYYIDQALDKPILGVGILSESEKYYEARVKLHGYKGIYYRDDVGIVGFFNCFGIVGLVWYILLCIKCFKSASNNLKSKYKNTELLGLVVYVVASSGTIIIMDIQRIIYLPIILSLMIVNNKN